MSQPNITYVLELTQPEREVLLGFIDAGLKALGLSVAQNAVLLATKVQNATPKGFEKIADLDPGIAK
jgi:hypothetical protein